MAIIAIYQQMKKNNDDDETCWPWEKGGGDSPLPRPNKRGNSTIFHPKISKKQEKFYLVSAACEEAEKKKERPMFSVSGILSLKFLVTSFNFIDLRIDQNGFSLLHFTLMYQYLNSIGAGLLGSALFQHLETSSSKTWQNLSPISISRTLI